jgi:hypothetical protein
LDQHAALGALHEADEQDQADHQRDHQQDDQRVDGVAAAAFEQLGETAAARWRRCRP